MGTMISVVIPTFNRFEMLAAVLPSYLRSELVGEVIIIDDGSSPTVREKIAELEKSDPRMQIIFNEKNIGAPASRNRGIAAAQGDLLLLSEDDLELGAHFLETLTHHMEISKADIIAGRRLWMRVGESKDEVIARSANNNIPVVNMRWLDHYSNAVTQDDIEIPLLDGTMLIRKDVTQRVQYHEPFGGPSTWREESDYQLTAVEEGYRLVFCPHVVCFHHSRASISYGTSRLKGNLRYLSRIFINNRIFLEKHRELLRREYPSALIFNNPDLTSIIYTIRWSLWMIKTESLRIYKSRKQQSFEWK